MLLHAVVQQHGVHPLLVQPEKLKNGLTADGQRLLGRLRAWEDTESHGATLPADEPKGISNRETGTLHRHTSLERGLQHSNQVADGLPIGPP